MKGAITPVFNEPVCEVPIGCTCLGHPITFVGVAQHIFSVCVVCFRGDWSLCLSHLLEHCDIKPRAALLVSNLANEAAILVGCPVPHLGETMCELALQSLVEPIFATIRQIKLYCLRVVRVSCSKFPDCAWVVRYAMDLVGGHTETLELD